MSAYPIDVQRLLSEQQRMQMQINAGEQRYRRALEQGQLVLAANQALRKQKDHIEAQRKKQVENMIAAHRLMYEKEIGQLRAEKQQLAERLQVISQRQNTSSFQLSNAVKSLKSQMEQKEIQKNILKQENKQLSSLVSDFETKIMELKSSNKQLMRIIQKQQSKQVSQIDQLTLQCSSLKKIIQNIQNQLQKQQRKSGQLLKEKYDIQKKLPKDLLQQIVELRKENNRLASMLENKVLDGIDQGDQLYNTIQRLYSQMALLKLEITQHKQKKQQAVVELYETRAKLVFESVKMEKQKGVKNQEINQMKLKLEQTKSTLKSKQGHQVDNEQLREEIGLLKIKLFTLEALRQGQPYKKQKQYDLKCFQEDLRSLIGAQFSVSTSQVLKSVVDLKITVNNLNNKIKEVQNQKSQAIKKSKGYKQKYKALNKQAKSKDEQSRQQLAHYKQKVHQYNLLVQRYQGQLQKACQLNAKVNQRRNLHLLVAPYQQKVELINTQVIVLQGQLRQYQATAKADQQIHQRQVKQLRGEVQRLKQQNSQLSLKCRKSQGLLLQKSLFSTDSGKNYQMQLAQKQRALVALQNELKSAKEMNAQHLDALRSSQERSFRQFKKELAKSQMMTAQKAQKQQMNTAQVEAMRQKLASFERLLYQYRDAEKNTKSPTSDQVGGLRIKNYQLQSQIQQKIKRQTQNKVHIQDYKARLLSLQQFLKKTINNYQQIRKDLQLQNNHLVIRLQRLQEELELSRDQKRGGKVKQIEPIERNNKYQNVFRDAQGQDKLRHQLQNKQQQLTFYKQEFQRLNAQHEQQKSDFLQNWHKLMQESQNMHRQLQEKQKYIASLPISKQQQEVMSPIRVPHSPLIVKTGGKNQTYLYQDKIYENMSHKDFQKLKKQLVSSQQKIQFLSVELSKVEQQLKRRQSDDYRKQLGQSGIYALKELSQLRDELQNMRHIKFGSDSRIRQLEQQNILLRVKKVQEDMGLTKGSRGYNNYSSNPTLSMAKSQIIKTDHEYSSPRNQYETNDYIKLLHSRLASFTDLQRRHQETLAVLTLVLVQKQALKQRVEQAEAKAQENYQNFINYLKEQGSQLEDIQVNASLINQFETAHHHFSELARIVGYTDDGSGQYQDTQKVYQLGQKQQRQTTYKNNRNSSSSEKQLTVVAGLYSEQHL